ncbi:MAG: glycosyltransferase family 4 protein [Glaciimonas sp.]|nr:glycosyltransferase family 4 protein [Glaciimonas sp.]
MQALDSLDEAGYTPTVVIGSHGVGGFVRSRRSVQTIRYCLCSNRWLLLLNFVLTQLLLFARVVRLCLQLRADTVYVNTVLPVGAILAAVLCRRRVILHLHEVSLGSPTLFRVLYAIASRGADRIICVSQYVADTLQVPAHKVEVVHNSLSRQAWGTATKIAERREPPSEPVLFCVVMACSLRWYKGIDAFMSLARETACRVQSGALTIKFELLLNCEDSEFRQFLSSTKIPPTVKLVQRPSSVFEHYRHAGLVLNLSHPEGAVETFGLTLLEAMACAVPVVCPTVGGCTELFTPGSGGWRIWSRDLDGLVGIVELLATDQQAWLLASKQALVEAQRFAPAHFDQQLRAVFETR